MNKDEDNLTDEVLEAEVEALTQRETPEEPIARHAKAHDSYRETNELIEIVQPPLDPSEDILDSELRIPETNVTEVIPTQEESATDKYHENISVDDLVSTVPIEDSVVEEIVDDVSLVPTVDTQETVTQVMPEAVPVPRTSTSETKNFSSEISDVVGQETPQYHTVSGGQETIHSLVVKHSPPIMQLTPAQINGVEFGTFNSTGYSLPQSSIAVTTATVVGMSPGFIIFLFMALLIGGPMVYFYFLLPDTFRQIVDAIMVVKNQLLSGRG